MKRIIKKSIPLVVFTLVFLFIMNIPVTTRQGFNYKVRNSKIPLFVKILDFFDRHYNYKILTQRIISDSKTDKEKVIKIFKWTYETIKKNPKELPVIDDHVWHIIIRGYGVNDQFSDVFTTLCNYIGVKAFYNFLLLDDNTHRLPLSFVEINKKYSIFDPFNGNYFVNDNGDLAEINEILNGNWRIENIGENSSSEVNYGEYFNCLIFKDNFLFSHGSIQSPLQRFIVELRKLLNN